MNSIGRAFLYKGHHCKEVGVTTDGVRMVHGKRVACIKRVWSVDGRFRKSHMTMPFLTSAKDCREWITAQIGMMEV